MSESVSRELLKKIYRGVESIVGDRLREVILYGSYARGDYDSESDVDIALILNLSREEAKLYKERIVEFMSELSLNNDVLVCISCIPATEFEKYKEDIPYYRNIDIEGVRLSA